MFPSWECFIPKVGMSSESPTPEISAPSSVYIDDENIFTHSYFLASRWFFQSLRLMKAAEPSGKRPLDIPKGGACSTKWSQESRALWRRERSKETCFFTTTRPSLPKDLSIFSGAEKRTKRDIHPPQGPSRIWRGCN